MRRLQLGNKMVFKSQLVGDSLDIIKLPRFKTNTFRASTLQIFWTVYFSGCLLSKIANTVSLSLPILIASNLTNIVYPGNRLHNFLISKDQVQVTKNNDKNNDSSNRFIQIVQQVNFCDCINLVQDGTRTGPTNYVPVDKAITLQLSLSLGAPSTFKCCRCW